MNPVKIITVLLLAVHGFLAVWALVGFIEWFWTTPPWNRISNPLFPKDILFMQWTLTLVAAATFSIGFMVRWPNTPVAMACIYAAMAALCAVESFRYLESEARFIAMGVEYLAYVGILVFLFSARVFQPV